MRTKHEYDNIEWERSDWRKDKEHVDDEWGGNIYVYNGFEHKFTDVEWYGFY